MTSKDDKTVEGVCGELDLFSVPVSQKGVISGDWIQFNPVHAINQDSPLVFDVQGQGDKYVDTSRTLLGLKIKVVDSKLQKLAADAQFTVINNVLSSLFNDCVVEYNQTVVSQCHQMYHMKAYFENLFNFNDSSKSTHLTAAGYFQDIASAFDTLSVPAKKRAEYLAESKTMELLGRLHADVLNTPRFLLNEINMRISLRRNSDSIVCMSTAELSPRVIIEDATLYVRKITLNPSILLAHAKILQQKTALYHFRRTEMLHYTIGQNVFQKSVENMLNGRVPQRIIMGLMKNSAFNGSYTQNVFNFEHFNLNYLNLSINGMTVGGKPLTPNYATGEYMQPYLMTFFGTGIGLSDDGHCISRDDFPNGFCLYCWDLTPDLSASEAHWSSTQDGNIRIEVGFAKELETTVSMIVYAEYRETLEIDRSRQCSLVYKG